jgi:hypothetical protein
MLHAGTPIPVSSPLMSNLPIQLYFLLRSQLPIH